MYFQSFCTALWWQSSFIRNSTFKLELGDSYAWGTNSIRLLLNQLFQTSITNVKPTADGPEGGESRKKVPTFSFHLSCCCWCIPLLHISWCGIIPVNLITWLTWTILLSGRTAYASVAKQHKNSLHANQSSYLWKSEYLQSSGEKWNMAFSSGLQIILIFIWLLTAWNIFWEDNQFIHHTGKKMP